MTIKQTEDENRVHDFEEVLALEHASIRIRRGAAKVETPDELGPPHGRPADLFGVSLSGGGIRSASYCLGALQALHAWGLIHRIDYLSTVSGGGYVGTSMIAGMHANQEENGEPGFPFARPSNESLRDPEAVSHLRDYSRFLAPRGLLDIITSTVIIMRGLAVNVLLLLSFLLPVATVFILSNPTTEELKHSILLDVANLVLREEWTKSSSWWLSVEPLIASPFLFSVITAICLCLWLIGWALRRSYVESFGRSHPNERASLEYDGYGARVGRWLIIAFVFAATMELQPIIIGAVKIRLDSDGGSTQGLAGLATITGAIVGLTAAFQGKLVVWIQRALSVPSIAAHLQSLLAKSVLYGAAMLLPLTIYAVFLLIVTWGIKDGGAFPHSPGFLVSDSWTFSTVIAGFAVLFLAATQVLSRRLKSRPWETLTAIVHGHFNVPILVLVGTWLVALVVAAIATRSGPSKNLEDWIILSNYLALSFAVAVVAAAFTENANGLHRLYRDRLRVAYRLGDKEGRRLPIHALPEEAPYLLVNGTLNARLPRKDERTANGKVKAGAAVAATDRHRLPDPAKRGRNAEFFLFSKHAIGSESTGYANPNWMWSVEPELDLAAAAAISGAAVSSSMGRIGIGLLGPTLALLNLRLGFWLPNPSRPKAQDRHWEDLFRLYLFAEAFGRLRSDSSRIYVTDGGHIDNIGLYQLLKRGCKFIIVIDAEADPGMNFSAFADVQRFARIDIGVLISLDWCPVRDAALERLADRSKSRSRPIEGFPHFAIGCITYENGDQGILLYIKAAVTGKEPDYVLDYERRYPNFPHEATSDQFFSEEQMEAYRALGFHAVNEVFAQAQTYASRSFIGPEPNYDMPYASMNRNGLLVHLIRRLNAQRTASARGFHRNAQAG
ncbi:patatin-like phospholipase family protein [Sinorhizobium meliloti]|uniref:patatin-like phospholipase family protein n=1 Tax=Rhizobium meliloti TaxID=382 RepID=UPI003D9FB6AC